MAGSRRRGDPRRPPADPFPSRSHPGLSLFRAALLAADRARPSIRPGDPRDGEAALAGLMAGRYFPVGLDRTAARKEFLRVRAGDDRRHPDLVVPAPPSPGKRRLPAGAGGLEPRPRHGHGTPGERARRAAGRLRRRGGPGSSTTPCTRRRNTRPGRRAGAIRPGWPGPSSPPRPGSGPSSSSHFNPAHTDADVDAHPRERPASASPATIAAAQGLRLGKE